MARLVRLGSGEIAEFFLSMKGGVLLTGPPGPPFPVEPEHQARDAHQAEDDEPAMSRLEYDRQNHGAEAVPDHAEAENPDCCGGEIERDIDPEAYAGHANGERAEVSKAVREPEDEDEQMAVPLDDVEKSLEALAPAGELREEPVALVAADQEEELIAGDASQEGADHHPSQIHIPLRGGDAGDEEGGLAFEEGADEEGEVAVSLDGVQEVHYRVPLC